MKRLVLTICLLSIIAVQPVRAGLVTFLVKGAVYQTVEKAILIETGRRLHANGCEWVNENPGAIDQLGHKAGRKWLELKPSTPEPVVHEVREKVTDSVRGVIQSACT